jgi:hypothetical protein
MNYKETRKDSTYVDLTSSDERKAMGKHLSIVHTENDKGSQVTVFYYESGIEDFDKLLNNIPFYEYGLSLHLLSCENAFLFRLYLENKKLVVSEFAIWRDSILNFEKIQNINAKFINVNRFLNILTQGTGLVGSSIKVLGGETLSRLTTIKTESDRAFFYNLKYKTDQGSIKEIRIYKRDRFNSDNSFFIEKNYYNSIDEITDTRCFIATACYGSTDCKELNEFRKFRDEVLLKSKLGETIVKFYYFTSPTLINTMGRSTKAFIKSKILDKFYNYLVNRKL